MKIREARRNQIVAYMTSFVGGVFVGGILLFFSVPDVIVFLALGINVLVCWSIGSHYGNQKNMFVKELEEMAHKEETSTTTSPQKTSRGRFCSECGKLVSVEAKFCPNCGKEVKT